MTAAWMPKAPEGHYWRLEPTADPTYKYLRLMRVRNSRWRADERVFTEPVSLDMGTVERYQGTEEDAMQTIVKNKANVILRYFYAVPVRASIQDQVNGIV